MKKRKIIIPLIVVLCFELVSMSLYFSFADFDAYRYKDLSLSKDDIIQKAFIDSFNSIKDDKQISFDIKNDSFNELLLSSSDNHFYVDMSENEYVFHHDEDLNILRTRLNIQTSLIEDDEQYIFKVHDAGIGHFPINNLILRGNRGKNLWLGKYLNDAGLSFKETNSLSELIYKKEDVYNDAYKMFSTFSNEYLDLLLANVDTSSSFSNGLSLNFDLSKLIDNPSKSDNKDNVEVDKVNLKETLIQRIKDVDYHEYESSCLDKEVSFLKESEFDSLLRKSKIISTPFSFESINIQIEDVYTDLFSLNNEAYMNYSIIISINGLKTKVIIETKCDLVPNSYNIKFDIQNIYYGEKIIENDYLNIVKEYFNVMMNELNDVISYIPNTNSFMIDIDSIIKEDTSLINYYSLFYLQPGVTRSLEVDKLSLKEDGRLVMKFSKI